MKHILALVTVAAALALSATAAFAAGDWVDYAGPGRPSSTIIPTDPSMGSASIAVAGSIGTNPYWAFRYENWGGR